MKNAVVRRDLHAGYGIGGSGLKKVRLLRRHILLLTIYGFLVLESAVRLVHMRGDFSSLRLEFLMGIALFALYVLCSPVYDSWIKHSKYNMLVERIHCGIAIIQKNEEFSLVRANSAFFKISGYTAEEFRDIFHNRTVHLIHEEDMPAILEMARQLNADHPHAHVDFRILNKHGCVKWIHMDTFFLHEAHKVSAFHCVFTDITAFRTSVEQVEFESGRYQIIARLFDDILFDYDISSKTMTSTRPISDLYGNNISIPCFYNSVVQNSVVHQKDLAALADFFDKLETGQDKRQIELRIGSSDGQYAWYRLDGALLRDKQQEPLKIIGKFTNIDHQKREREYLTQKLQRDPMTGIFNKVVTEQLVDRYLQKVRSDDVSTLFILDVDNFKHINDSLGHLYGDKALTHIAHEIQQILRTSDIFGRIGGDEFVVFIKNIKTRALAEKKAQELCSLFRGISLLSQQHYAISVSIGMAMFPQDGRTYHELFAKADRALYIAKGQGKDRFSFYQDEAFDGRREKPHIPDSAMLTGPSPLALAVSNQRIVESLLVFLNENCMDKNATQKMLAIVCQYYKVKRVCVLEFSEDGQKIDHVHYWNEEKYMPDTNHFLIHTEVFWKNYLQYFDQSYTFQCNSLQKIGMASAESPTLTSLQHVVFYHQQPASILMLDNDLPQGHLTFYELSILEIVHSLVQYHLLLLQKLRVSQELINIDALTGVHAYEAFHTVLVKTLMSNPNKPYALISCDINRFSEINDLIGHDQADQVLIAFTSVIQRGLEPGEHIGRVSADIFCILANCEDRAILSERMDLWDRVFLEEIKGFHLPSNVEVAVGVYEIQSQEDTPATMFDRANVARKLSKNSRTRMIRFYDERVHEKTLYEKDMESYMRASLQDNDFIVYLQPQYRLTDRKIAAAEALVRWEHPIRGFIQPSAFIPLFEKNYFVVELDFYVLERVCQMLRRWIDKAFPIVPIAVNFSRVHLATKNFVSRVLHVVETYEIPPSYLEIELTESAYINRTSNVLKIAQELRGYGFRMAMDDFGAGYSSLNSLKSLSFDILKLDRNFFQEKEPTPKETIIIENIVRLAKQLDLCVVSEGVEFEWQAEFLCSVDCDLVQGYLFSCPIPIYTFEKELREHANPLLQCPD